MKFTIVTTTYNAEKNISLSLDSIIEQTYIDWEYCIIDGHSTDNTIKIVETYSIKNSRIRIVSEPDSGIYNAMNKASNIAKGEYIYFLGAGDVLYSSDVLEKINMYICKEKSLPDIVYGWVYYDNGDEYRYKINFLYTLRFRPISHQAIFAKTKLLKEKKFNETYRITADQDWIMSQYKLRKRIKYINLPIAIYDTGGLSSSSTSSLLAEKEMKDILTTYYPNRLPIYILIKMMRKLLRVVLS